LVQNRACQPAALIGKQIKGTPDKRVVWRAEPLAWDDFETVYLGVLNAWRKSDVQLAVSHANINHFQEGFPGSPGAGEHVQVLDFLVFDFDAEDTLSLFGDPGEGFGEMELYGI